CTISKAMSCPDRRRGRSNGLPSICEAKMSSSRAPEDALMAQLIEWVDERLDLSGIRHFIAEKGVPIHAQKIWYYLGGMTLFLFVVEIASGILLLLYYRPRPSGAYESVQFIVTQVQFGGLIRNLDSWSANL